MFYDSAASGGAAGGIQAYDRDGGALTRLKIGLLIGKLRMMDLPHLRATSHLLMIPNKYMHKNQTNYYWNRNLLTIGGAGQ